MHSIPIALSSLALVTTLAVASPEVRVEALDGVPRIELVGDYAHRWYAVLRAPGPDGAYEPVGAAATLCLGPCFVEDPEARAGATYWYRFDFLEADGSTVSLGPFAVTIPSILARRVGARVVPNPVHGSATIEVFLAGGAGAEVASTRVRVVDLQGRTVRHLREGSLPSGLSRLAWDGRDDAGHPVGPGLYFVTVRSPLGDARARLLRLR